MYPFMFFPLIKGSTHLKPDDFPSSMKLLVSSADNLCKQSESRSGPTECLA